MVSIGYWSVCSRAIRDDLQEHCVENQFNFIAIPLFHPRFRRNKNNNLINTAECPLTRSDLELTSHEWMSRITGIITSCLEFESPDSAIRLNAENLLDQELKWSSYLGLKSIILPTPIIPHSPNYARLLLKYASETPSQQMLCVRTPLTAPTTNVTIENKESSDGWLIWDNFRNLCSWSNNSDTGCSIMHRLAVALEINKDNIQELYHHQVQEEGNVLIINSLQRWIAEPVSFIILSTKDFIMNKSGYPVLSKLMQHVVGFFMNYRIQIILTGKPHAPSINLLLYSQYLRHLQEKFKSNSSQEFSEKFTSGYQDTLQSPLQPLMDNLESQTYETFERDPSKYSQYENAMKLAFHDVIEKRFMERQLTGAQQDPPKIELVVTIVGAGRGPLVACALSAASYVQDQNRCDGTCIDSGKEFDLKVYAVEKNPNAIITLRNRKISEQWGNVQIIHKDMRDWIPSELSDVMISELLGSFGDNELSPECLDGAEKCLKSDGISIPQEYQSYAAPVASSKLWMIAKELMQGKGLDTPYVVKLHHHYLLSNPAAVFCFRHPSIQRNASPMSSESTQTDNSRYITISFEYTNTTESTLLHGFAGYFDSILYKDVMISIVPSTHTPGMFSWFPLFIPLRQPIRINYHDMITFHIWRLSDTKKVWYEWCLTSPVITPIQNSNGHAYFMGL